MSAIGPIIAGAPPDLIEPHVTFPGGPPNLDSRKSWELYESIFAEYRKVIDLRFKAVMAATDALKVMERQIRICSYLIYILGIVVAALGIYAAIVLKSEGNEPSR